MIRTFYDNLDLNKDIQLDLSMLEATGSLLHDESKNHSTATMHTSIGTPLWLQTPSSRYGIDLNRIYPALDTEQFYDIPAVDCLNLDFINDYSLAMWFYWDFAGHSQIMMGKYVVDSRGWEAYLYSVGGVDSLNVRHWHGVTRSATYSVGWTQNEWHLWSYSRIGANAYHYRDGDLIPTIGGPLQNPDSTVGDDFRIGCRFTEDSNWFKARFHRPRAWSRALAANEHKLLYRLGYP